MSNFNNDRSGVNGGNFTGSYDSIATTDEDDDDGDDVCRGHGELIDRNHQTGRVRHKRNFQKIVRLFSCGKGNKKKQVIMQSNHGNRGKRIIGCCLCLRQPQTYESASGVVLSDDEVKNDINFSHYESVKILVEENEFYDKDCNTHVSFVSLHPD